MFPKLTLPRAWYAASAKMMPEPEEAKGILSIAGHSGRQRSPYSEKNGRVIQSSEPKPGLMQRKRLCLPEKRKTRVSVVSKSHPLLAWATSHPEILEMRCSRRWGWELGGLEVWLESTREWLSIPHGHIDFPCWEGQLNRGFAFRPIRVVMPDSLLRMLDSLGQLLDLCESVSPSVN